MHMKFRSDINGLRAIAVIAVVLFHFNQSLLTGGFAGVDIFFVISGFLMTSIIFRGMENDSFSLFKFYVSRANRIIPALAALSFVLLVFGWFFLSPMDYKVLGKHIASSLVFISNIMYWGESGYFDAASYEKWLLHTWSLSVEWQFYIVYPMVLLFLKRFISFEKVKWFIVIGIVVSFSMSVYASILWSNAAYYLLPSRAWEMLLGGAAYLYPVSLNNKSKKWTEWLGLILILLSYILISKEDLWPGYLALFPVFGAYLIILANNQTSIFTNNVIFQKIGKWSYSIYLWHWPIIVYGYYFPTKHWFFIGISLSVFLGWLSFKFIESHKFPSFHKWKQFMLVKPFLFSIVLGSLAMYVYVSQGVMKRFDNRLLIHKLARKMVMPHRGNGYCFYSFNNDKSLKVDGALGQNCFMGQTTNKQKSDTLLFGDSYAGTYDPFWNMIFTKFNKKYQSVSTNWCSPSFTENFTGPKQHPSYQQCLLNRTFLKEAIIHKRYKNIIFASSWNSVLSKKYIDDFLQVVAEASKHHINIFVMATPPAYIRNPIPLYQKNMLSQQPFDLKIYERKYKSNNYVNDLLKKKLEKYPNVYFIDREMIFAKTNTFRYKGLNVPYSLDGGHMSLIGSEYAAKFFIKNSHSMKILEKLSE